MGTLMRNITGQVKLAIRIPPKLGPVIFPTPTMLPVMPRALPLSPGGKALETIPIPVAIIILAPMACITRAATK